MKYLLVITQNETPEERPPIGNLRMLFREPDMNVDLLQGTETISIYSYTDLHSIENFTDKYYTLSRSFDNLNVLIEEIPNWTSYIQDERIAGNQIQDRVLWYIRNAKIRDLLSQ
ncbi:MAG: hypothetical protein H0X33_04490 [Taibaiella sp.]|nr:hypothetical protein [Taibaiella sp.]